MEFTRKKGHVSVVAFLIMLCFIPSVLYQYYSRNLSNYRIWRTFEEVEQYKSILVSQIFYFAIFLICFFLVIVYFVNTFDEKIKISGDQIEVYRKYFKKYMLVSSLNISDISCFKTNYSVGASGSNEYSFDMVDTTGKIKSRISLALYNYEQVNFIDYMANTYGIELFDNRVGYQKGFNLRLGLIFVFVLGIFGVFMYYYMKTH